jgi:rRNA-processing protein FCF1
MSNYKIEKGIPIPRSRATKYEFIHKMEPGDSVLVERLAAVSVSRLARRYGIKVITRRQGDGQCRLWVVGKRKKTP